MIHSQGGDLSVIHPNKEELGPDTTKLQATTPREYFPWNVPYDVRQRCCPLPSYGYVYDEISFYLLNSHQVAMLRVLGGKLGGDGDVDLGLYISFFSFEFLNFI